MKNNTVTANELLSISIQLVRESIQVIFEVEGTKNLQESWKGKNDPLTIADVKSQTLIINGLNHHFPQIKIVGEEDEVYPDAINVDFTKQSKKLFPKELFPDDLLINLDELTAFIDPLDGTYGFVKGDLNYVSVLLGFALNKRPIIGVFGQIWSLDGNGKIIYDPKIYFGYNQTKRVYCLNSSDLNKTEMIPVEVPRPIEKDFSKEFIVIYSKYKMNDFLEKNIEQLKPTKTIKAGATGYKILQVVKGLADCYFYEVEELGTKRWDTCVGEALLSCFDGITTGKDGSLYDYVFGMDQRNLKGVISSINRVKHEEIIKITSQMHYDVKKASE